MLLKQHRFVDPLLYHSTKENPGSGKELASYWIIDKDTVFAAIDLVGCLNDFALKFTLSPIRLDVAAEGVKKLFSELFLPESTIEFAKKFMVGVSQAHRMETSLNLDSTKDDRNQNQLVLRIKFYKKKAPKVPFCENKIEFWMDGNAGIHCRAV